MIGINLLLVIILTTIIVAEQKIRSIPYKLSDNITSLEGGSSIDIELTFIHSSAAESTLEVETKQWVHDCCLMITTEPALHIHLKQNYGYYPKVTAYVRLRKSLSSIKLNQAANLVMKNIMKTDILLIELAGASTAQVNIEIISNLYVSISGAANMIMSGFVYGTADINVHQAGKLDAQSCLINVVIVDVSGAGVAYIDGEQSISITTTQAGNVYQKGSIRYKTLSTINWFKVLFSSSNAASRTSNQSIDYFLMLFFIIYFFLFYL